MGTIFMRLGLKDTLPAAFLHTLVMQDIVGDSTDI